MYLQPGKLCRWLMILSVWFVLTACIGHASHWEDNSEEMIVGRRCAQDR